MPGADPVQPDFVLILKAHTSIIRDGQIYGVPDLIAEVLSAGTRDYDENVKLGAYTRAGVPEYALADPMKRQIRIYRLLHPSQYADTETFNADDTVNFVCLPTIGAQVKRLFEGAPDTTL